MLKISRAGKAGRSVTLKLEGRLAAEWVGELRRVCEKLIGEGRTIKLNRAEVSFVDPDGVKFLAELVSHGIKLVDCSLFVGEQLKPVRGA